MTEENTQKNAEPKSGLPSLGGGDPPKEHPRDETETADVQLHRSEARSQRLLVWITAIYTIVAGGTLWDLHDQTKASIKAADAAATAASVANSTLRETVAQATAESTSFNKQLSKLNDSIQAANRQADASNRQADASDRQAKASNLQAVAAAGNLREAESQLSMTRSNFTAQQRPYVWVTIPQIYTDNTRFRFIASLQIGNYGRGSAQNIKIAWNINHSLKGDAEKASDAFFAQPEKYWRWSHLPPFPPGVSTAPSFNISPAWGPYPPDTYRALWQTMDGLAIYGRVEYTDAQGHPFHTDFCIGNVGNGAQGQSYYVRHNTLQ